MRRDGRHETTDQSFSVREGGASDLDALERLETAAFATDRLSRRSLRYFLRVGTSDVPVAERSGAIVGYAMIGFRAGSRLARIFSLAVDPGCARQGIGRALLEACEARARARGSTAVRLEVRADNRAAIRLYETAGYRGFETLDDYYEDGAAALRFDKPVAWPPPEPDAPARIANT